MSGPGDVRSPAWTTHSKCARMVLAAALLAITVWAVSRFDRLPGPLGDVFRHSRASGRDAGALFYTDVDGWRDFERPVVEHRPDR